MTDELQATIFRLPLRTTQQAASSRISPRPFTAANAEELLRAQCRSVSPCDVSGFSI